LITWLSSISIISIFGRRSVIGDLEGISLFIKPRQLATTVSIICVGLILGVPQMANGAKIKITQVARISLPPSGKALVNLYRPMGGPIRNPIFDETGKLLMDMPGKSTCQLVLEPGSKSLISWCGANPISVTSLNLAPDKTYDLVLAAVAFKGVFFVPLSQAPKKLKDLQKLEKAAPGVYVMERDAEALAYEAMQKEKIEEIKRDFLGGRKSDRVVKVRKDDCR